MTTEIDPIWRSRIKNAKYLSPSALLNALADENFMLVGSLSDRLRYYERHGIFNDIRTLPGEYLLQQSPEVRAKLAQLKSDDIKDYQSLVIFWQQWHEGRPSRHRSSFYCF
jgi:hypothetical protein